MSDTVMNSGYPHDTSPEAIWAILRETADGYKETRKALDELRESQKETSRQMQLTDKKIGELSNRFGELAEHLVAPNIMEKFNALGFAFARLSQNIRIADAAGNYLAELDILLENGNAVMAVEVKAKPNDEDVKKHISRMEVLRREADARNDRRIYQGAIAGAIMSGEVRAYVLKNGFYPIEQTGDTVAITAPEGFAPRQW